MDRQPAHHRRRGLRPGFARVRLLLPALQQQRPAVATGRHNGSDRHRSGDIRDDPRGRGCSPSSAGGDCNTGARVDWQVAGWTTVLAGLIAIGLQIWQLTQLPFYPGSSGYASCFIGWASMNIAMILCATYWSRPCSPGPSRLHRALAEEGGNLSSPLPAERLFRANVEGCSFFWGFVAVAAAFFWLLFYVI